MDFIAISIGVIFVGLVATCIIEEIGQRHHEEKRKLLKEVESAVLEFARKEQIALDKQAMEIKAKSELRCQCGALAVGIVGDGVSGVPMCQGCILELERSMV